jgi:uncharacterized ferritin-like protein (DUF455 family)
MLAFHRPEIENKLKFLEDDFLAIKSRGTWDVPDIPARDVQILPPQFHPDKKGFSHPEGQARLLHDLASIELQAMELGLRTLVEFPQAPAEFQEELIEITRSEGQHLRLCLTGLTELGSRWGAWPVHCTLWMATSKEDSLLDRLLIVHRYLEGSGLDAGDQILKKLKAVKAPLVTSILGKITQEEVDHVRFGSNWYHSLCELENLDPFEDFPKRMWKIRDFVPKRIEKISHELRRQAGFTDFELKVIDDIRNSFL